ncbi:uncharacterized protein LOC143032864 [Oratosquilla oratoria]|uniref:uncharacterized protein LOC143032864 n=1 Tax=Oratosquilla oratoria TaxID=337810 RepID=UPI003F7614A3
MASLALCTYLVVIMATFTTASLPQDENSAKLISILQKHASVTTDTQRASLQTTRKDNAYQTYDLVIERVTDVIKSTSTATITKVATSTHTEEGILPCPIFSTETQQISSTEPVTTTSTVSLDVVQAILPSCDCNSSRDARQMNGDDNVLHTIKLTYTLTSTHTVTVTVVHPEVTASIIYSGCLPYDAVEATSCATV